MSPEITTLRGQLTLTNRTRECRHTWQTRGATFMGISTVTRWCSCPGYVPKEES